MSRELKDSGVEWIGEIPANWSVEKIKYTTYVKGRIGWQGLKSDEFTDEGPYLVTGKDFIGKNINWESCHHVSKERYYEAPPIQLKENDLLITKDGTIGKTAIVRDMPDKAILNSGIFVTRSAKYEVDFMYWMLNSQVFDKYIKFFETGSTIKHLYQETFENFSYPLPTRLEQKKISLFLNRKIKLVDEVINNKEKMMTLLEKQRQSIITEAVTKGLNPNVKMKDSGVEWIGEIPEHWEVKRLKNVLDLNPSKNEVNALKGLRVTFLPMENILGPNEVDISITKNIEEVYSGYTYFKNNDLVMAKVTPCFENGNIAVMQNLENSIGFGTTELHVLRAKPKQNITFYFYLAQSAPFKQEGVSAMYGVGGLKRIPSEFIFNYKFARPSVSEQNEIVEFLNEKCTELESIKKLINGQIDKLKEYRQSLIYEAVTGKIDVRDMELDLAR